MFRFTGGLLYLWIYIVKIDRFSGLKELKHVVILI